MGITATVTLPNLGQYLIPVFMVRFFFFTLSERARVRVVAEEVSERWRKRSAAASPAQQTQGGKPRRRAWRGGEVSFFDARARASGVARTS